MADQHPHIYIFFSSAKIARETIYCTHVTLSQLRTELVQNVPGPGQRTKRGCFDKSKVGLSKVVKAIRMAIDVSDPLRQVLDSWHAVRRLVPACLASGFPCVCSRGFHGCTSLLGPLPHLSSFALQPAPLLLPPPPPPLLLPKLSFLSQQLLGTLENPVIRNDGGLPLPRLLPQSPVLTASAHWQGLLTFALMARRFLGGWRQG